MKERVYVASPYSIVGGTNTRKDPVLEKRFQQVTRFIASMMMTYGDKLVFYGPVTHSHSIAQYMPDEYNTHNFWVEGQDRSHLEHSDQLWVFKMDGWDQSKGVTTEIQIARELSLPIYYWEQVVEGIYSCVKIEGIFKKTVWPDPRTDR